MANTWVFQANPEFYLLDEALRTMDEHVWLVQQHRKEIHVGDKVYIWRGGQFAAMLGRGTILSEPAEIEPDPSESKFMVQPLRFSGKRCRVRIKTERFASPLTKTRMISDPILNSWYFLQGLEGTNFKVSPEVEAAIEKLFVSSEARSQTSFTRTATGQKP